MKANKIGPLVFLAAGTLVLALLLQMAGRGVLPRSSRAGAPPTAEILVTDPMTGAETLQFYEDRQGIDADTTRRWLGAKVDSFADDATVVVSVPLQASSAYAPYLDLYCQVDGDGPDWSILSIYSVQLCGAAGDTRPFAGDISVFLRGDREIEYIVNGDFSGKEPWKQTAPAVWMSCRAVPPGWPPPSGTATPTNRGTTATRMAG